MFNKQMGNKNGTKVAGQRFEDAISQKRSAQSGEDEKKKDNSTYNFKQPQPQAQPQYKKIQAEGYQQYYKQFNQLKDLLQKECYHQQPQTREIQQSIKKIQEQDKYWKKLKSQSRIEFMEYTYQKGKFNHFKGYENTALKFINQLLSFQAKDLKQAKISKLNLGIFKYLIRYFTQDDKIQKDGLSSYRLQLLGLLKSIKQEEDLSQVQNQQMVVFVCSLYYNYALAKHPRLNYYPDKELNAQKVEAELQSLAKIVLRYGLQLNLSKKDRIVKKVQLISLKPQLYNNRNQMQSQNWKVRTVSLNNSTQNRYGQHFKLAVDSKNTLCIKKKGQKLFVKENKISQAEYLLSPDIFDDNAPHSKIKINTRENKLYFLNLPSIYICKTNSAINSNLQAKWIKVYQHRTFIPAPKYQWQIFQANSLTLTLKNSLQSQSKKSKKIDTINTEVILTFFDQKSVQLSALSSSSNQHSFKIKQNDPKIEIVKKQVAQINTDLVMQINQETNNQVRPQVKDYIIKYNQEKNENQKISRVNQIQNMGKSNQETAKKGQETTSQKSQNRKRKRKTSQYYYTGLHNLGNTCYMNSALQCLHKSKPFTDLCSLLSQQIKNKFKNKRTYELTQLFLSFIQQMWQSKKPLSPWKIKEVMGEKNYLFKHYNQSDATQFFLTFILIISQELNNPTEQQQKEIDHYREDSRSIYEKIKFNDETYCKSIIEETFTGRYRVEYTSKLSTCKHRYILFEKFNVHYVDIPPAKHGIYYKQSVTLQQCLKYSSQPDTLRPQDRMTCDRCGKSTFDVKNMQIYEAGKILVFSFKRFLDGRKNQADIKVPEYLQPSQVIIGEELQNYKGMRYKLYGAIIHYGNLKGGHYFAVCYNYKSSKWVQYNDSIASETSQRFQQIDFSKAMTIFYELDRQQDELIQKYPIDNVVIQLSKQQKKTYNMVCSVIHWLMRSSPFQRQFRRRVQILYRYQILLGEDLVKFQKMLDKQLIDEDYLVTLIHKIKTFFQPAENNSQSQLQNFIKAFLGLVSQLFFGQYNQKIKQKVNHFPKELSQIFETEITADLLQANYHQNKYLQCKDIVKKEFILTYEKIPLSEKKQQESNLITSWLRNSRKYQSHQVLQCKKCCNKAQVKYIQYQLIKTSKLFMIELQRFTKKGKQCNPVNIPLQLNIKDIVKEHQNNMYKEKIYKLSAVFSRRESAQEDGQYFVQCIDFKKGKWTHCLNNQEPIELDVSNPKFKNAYCLIYELAWKY